MKIRNLLLLGIALSLPVGVFAGAADPVKPDPAKPVVAAPAKPPAPAPHEEPAPAPPAPTPPAPTPPAPTPPAPTPPAPTPPAPTPPPPPAPAAKALSWLEVSAFAPGLCDYNDAFKARLKATCKLKLRYLRRQCNFIAMVNPDPAIKAKAKSISADCKALIGG